MIYKVKTNVFYPLPQYEDFLDWIGSAKDFTSFNLFNEYWQCCIAEEDILKTAFLIRHDLYKWVVMPMRLMNAPATFM